jgi:hypothetical protein
MSDNQQPRLRFLSNRKYHCDDIPALHRWLEAHGYQYYGQFDPGEYGRFSCQDTHDLGDRRSYVHSFIQVWANGEIYAPDPHAHHLLNTLLTDDPLERTV